MQTLDPFRQSSDGGDFLMEWKDDLPPAGASRRAQRVMRGLGRPTRDAKRAWKAGPPGGRATVGEPRMNPIRPMNPITFAEAGDASPQSGSSSASGSSGAPNASRKSASHRDPIFRRFQASIPTAPTDWSWSASSSQRWNRCSTWPSRLTRFVNHCALKFRASASEQF